MLANITHITASSGETICLSRPMQSRMLGQNIDETSKQVVEALQSLANNKLTDY